MHDIRAIRDTPHAFDAALGRRGLAPQAELILELDETRRTRIKAAEDALAARNAASQRSRVPPRPVETRQNSRGCAR